MTIRIGTIIRTNRGRFTVIAIDELSETLTAESGDDRIVSTIESAMQAHAWGSITIE
jgi:hypothetical protein